jgi:predicted metal-dependent peptidase
MQPQATPARPSDRQRIRRLYRAVDHAPCPELAKQVYYLGRPRFAESCSTASLATIGDGQTLFLFNRDFFDALGPDALVFVLLHEALHYAFRHHLRRGRRMAAAWNVACDLVVNEFLIRRLGFADVADEGFREFLASAVTFENVRVAEADDRLHLTAEEVYERLKNDVTTSLMSATRANACDEHAWAQDDPEAPMPRELVEEFVDLVQGALRDCAAGWGDEPLGELRAIRDALQPARLNWDVILSRRIASCVKLAYEQRWAPPGRKIAWLFPSVLLPAEHEIEKLHASILLAIDASGSILHDVLDRLLRIARGVPPDRVELTAISFDTAAYGLDVWADPPQVRGGGGTSFDAIEQFAAARPRYPDLVVVLTDGYAPRPTVSHPDRWFWLITRQGTADQVQGIGRCCRIEELRLP